MRRSICILCLCACALSPLFVVPARAGEPTYHHKTLTRWLKEYQKAKPGSAGESDSMAAVRAMETNAVPRLVRMLASGDLDREQLAVKGFEILGPAAASAVPELQGLMTGTNPVVGVMAASSLGYVGPPAMPGLLNALTNGGYNVVTLAVLALVEMGTNAAPAVPLLVRDLDSPNRFVREHAVNSLGNLHLEPEIVVPALTNLLGDSSLTVRCLALSSLGRFEGAARPVIPAILPLLGDANAGVRMSATNALCEIAPDKYKRPGGNQAL